MYRPCNAKNCERIIRGNSTYCSMHRRRFAKYGDPDVVDTKTLPLPDRFALKYEVCKKTGCWNWTGSTNRSGYGTMSPTGFGTLAHRISYGLHVGPIPKGNGPHGTCVCHSCDNPACVNPEHLFLGSNAENMSDRNSKGRQARLRGSRNGHSKLKESVVSEIKAMLADGVTQCDIAEKYSVSQATISDIKLEKIWSHVK